MNAVKNSPFTHDLISDVNDQAYYAEQSIAIIEAVSEEIMRWNTDNTKAERAILLLCAAKNILTEKVIASLNTRMEALYTQTKE